MASLSSWCFFVHPVPKIHVLLDLGIYFFGDCPSQGLGGILPHRQRKSGRHGNGRIKNLARRLELVLSQEQLSNHASILAIYSGSG